MEYRVQHHLRIPKLTLGTVQLGMPYGIANKTGQPDESQSQALLFQAERAGISSYDTAAAYGDAEAVLGRYFQDNPRTDRLIVTKVKLEAASYTTDAELEKAVRSQLENSLRQLRVNHIPIYLLHQADDLHRFQKRLVVVMEKLVRENLIGLAGVSVYHAADLDKMLQYDVFQATQIPINIFDQRLVWSGHLERLRQKNAVVFARSVFLQGLFFLDPDHLPPLLAEAAPLLRQLHRLAEDEQLSIAQLAISFVRDLPGISSLVLGSETVDQVRENIRLLAAPPLSSSCRNIADRLFRDVPEQVLNPARWRA